jgi:hypothetical protein
VSAIAFSHGSLAIEVSKKKKKKKNHRTKSQTIRLLVFVTCKLREKKSKSNVLRRFDFQENESSS